MTSNLRFAVSAVLVLAAACNRHHEPEPSPLGTFTNDQVPSWAAECATPLVQDHVCGNLPWRPDCRGFHSAQPGDWFWSDLQWATTPTHRYLCKAPGWSLWTDDLGRVITICSDDVPDAPQKSATLRLLDLVTRHWGKQKSDEILGFLNGHDLRHGSDWTAWYAPINPRVIDDPPDPPHVVPVDPSDPRQTRCVEFQLHK